MKPIIGYENKYAVDEQGNVWSFPNKAHSKTIRLKNRIRKNGYACISLCNGKNISDHLVHRLVAQAFIGDINGKQVNHINGDRSDNRAVNLEIVAASQNILHGMYVLKNGNAKLTHDQAQEIKYRVKCGERQVDLAREFQVLKQTISQIVRGVGYKNSDIATQYSIGAA